jgi:hypothetical protein
MEHQSFYDSLGKNIKTIWRDEYGKYSTIIFKYKYDFSFQEPKVIEEKWAHLNIKKEYNYDSAGREIACIEVRDDIDTSKEFHFYDGVNYNDSVVYYSSNGKVDKYVSSYLLESQKEEFIRYDDNDSIYLVHFTFFDDSNNIILDSIKHMGRYIQSTHNIYNDLNQRVESHSFNNGVLWSTKFYYYHKNGLPKEHVLQGTNKTIFERINYEYKYY